MLTIAQLRGTMQTAPFVVPVLGGKGGIGKSLISQLISTKLGILKGRVLMVDTDHTNSSTKTVDPDATMVDLRDATARGGMMVALTKLAAGEYQSIVMDTGAQEDGFVAEWLPWLKKESASIGALLVPVLPITLSSHTQARALAFAGKATRLGLPTLLVKNLGQGRKPSDYAHWNATKSRANALAQGVGETDLPDLGARWTDEASGFGLSLADAAQGRFEKAGNEADKARAIFTPDVQAWLAIFVAEFGDAFIECLTQAIAKRIELDGQGS